MKLPSSASVDIIGFVITELPAQRAGVRVSVDGDARATLTRPDGSFVVQNASAGVHLLEFFHPALIFPTFKVQVPIVTDTVDSGGGGDQAPSIRVVEYKHPGAAKLAATHPLEVRPVAPAIYFEERPQSSILSMLMQPQVLIMVAVAGLAFCMPKITQAMDPEAQREFQESQAAMADPMTALRALWNGEAPAAAPPARIAARGAAATSRIAPAESGAGRRAATAAR